MNAIERAMADFETWQYVEAMREHFAAPVVEPTIDYPAWDSLHGDEKRDALADILIDSLKSDSYDARGRFFVEVAVGRISRSPTIKTLTAEAVAVYLAAVQHFGKIDGPAATTAMVEAYVNAEPVHSQERRTQALAAARWAVTRPAVIVAVRNSRDVTP